MKMKYPTILVLLMAMLLASTEAQVGPDIGENVDNYMDLVFEATIPELYGRCHACVFNSSYTVYVRQSPVCYYDYKGQRYNIAEDIERYWCFNDDPRLYDDIQCITLLSNDTFDCYKANQCVGNPNLEEGQTVVLEPDRRCQYKINYWNKDDVTQRKLLFADVG